MTRRIGWAIFIGTATASLCATAHAQPATGERRVAIVVRVATGALFGPNGEPSSSNKPRLTRIATSLEGLLAAEVREIPISLAASPVLCDELALLGTPEAQRIRRAIRSLAARGTVVSSPYADVRLPDLGTGADMRREMRDGKAALRACTGRAVSDFVLPPGFALDADALDALRSNGVGTALWNRVDEPRRTGAVVLVPARPIRAGPSSSSAVALIASSTDTSAARRIRSIASDRTLTVSPLATLDDDPTATFVPFPAFSAPPDGYRRALAAAQRELVRFRSYTLGDNRLVRVLRTAIERARGSAALGEDWKAGRRRAGAVSRTIRAQERLVRATGGSVTFTSRRGSVPVTVAVRTTYPVRIRATASSPKLSFVRGSTRVMTIAPPGNTITFAAVARSTGTFPVRINVTSPDRSVHFARGELTVRSTAANVPALALTAGGAIFLAGWFARRLVRRRR